jgi:sugar/nucleoside kinase (ribokinase family)
VQGDHTVQQDAIKVGKVVDSTGAGDAYTAGFLCGLAKGRDLADCARMGTWCATRVIQQVGARIEKDALAGFE